jgi:RNA polymerase sigma factor (sigma-70 family)
MSPDGPPSAIELLDLARDGDATALTQLLTRVHDAVLGKVRSILGGESPYEDDIAWDSVTPGALAVAQCRAENDREVFAWFLAIARNSAFQELRRATRTNGNTAAKETVSQQRIPPRVRAEMLEALRIALGKLGTPTAWIFELRVVQCASWAEVGKVLGIEPDAARVRWYRALIELRSEIAAIVVESAATRGEDVEVVKHYLGAGGTTNLPSG